MSEFLWGSSHFDFLSHFTLNILKKKLLVLRLRKPTDSSLMVNEIGQLISTNGEKFEFWNFFSSQAGFFCGYWYSSGSILGLPVSLSILLNSRHPMSPCLVSPSESIKTHLIFVLKMKHSELFLGLNTHSPVD